MGNELIKKEDFGDAPLAKYDKDAFDDMFKGGGFLPRLQLMIAASDKCKKGEFPINNFALIRGTEHQDLGSQVDVVLVTWRPQALDISDGVHAVYDPESDDYKRIAELAEQAGTQNYMYGPQFLVWIPAVKQFAGFYLGSKSGRIESPNVFSFLQKAATLKSHEIKTKKFTWFATTAIACSTPLDLPEKEAMKEEVDKFLNPPKNVVEKVIDNESEEERAR